MPIPNSDIIRFSPSSLSDSLDETDLFPGAMSILSNLIPDPSTKNVWICRPACVEVSPTSVANIVYEVRVGDRLYGFRNSILNPGKDEPFCFDITTSTFLAIGNITVSNTPTTQGTVGDWVPPTITVVGVNVIFTHPGFNGITTFFGWVDTSDPNALLWNAGNLFGLGAIQVFGTITPGSGYVNGTYSNVLFTSSSIRTLGTPTGGTGYVTGNYANVPLTGGTGSSALANIQVTGGVVTTVTLISGGTGYGVGNVLSASNVNLGGSGTGFSINVGSISPGAGAVGIVTVTSGGVASIVLTSRGTGYATTDAVTTSNVNLGGTGSGFAVRIALVYQGQLQLSSRPAWVAQFGQRAYFGINPPTGQPSTPFTDILSLSASNADQVLTYGDNLPLIAGHGLPLNNQLGGIVQSLLIFKGTAKAAINIQQITGDYATQDLKVNALNVATGTLSPWTICDTPKGVAFLAPDGYRLIDFNAQISDPIGIAGSGVVVPFLNCVDPTRTSASCNANILRVSVRPLDAQGSAYKEYWFDISRKVWSGPHTCPSRCSASYGNSFFVVPIDNPSQLFRSDVVPNSASTYIENGIQMQFRWRTVMLSDPTRLAMMSVSDLTVNMALTSDQGNLTIAALDENSAVYNFVLYKVRGSASLWGSMVWGVDSWGGGGSALRPRYAAFDKPVVFRRLALDVSGISTGGFKIGDAFIRRQLLEYPQPEL